MTMTSELVSGLSWIPFLAELALKATVVLALTAAAAVALRRYSAAARHMVWCVGLASVLALPVLSVLVPAWELPVLPTSSSMAAAGHASTAPGLVLAVPAVSAEASSVTPSASSLGRAEAFGPGEGASRGGGWLDRAIAAVLIAGMVMGLLWVAAGFWGAARIGRRAEVVRDRHWLDIAQEMSARLGLRRPVLLVRSGGAVMPATWGLFWPSVVLPAAADEWPVERRKAVLAHELAHVKRFDCLTQALAHLTCVLFWWHPAVWYAARRLRVERERACDDLVLLAGTPASDYAMHLLEIARSYRSEWIASPALVSIAKPSQLETRLLSVLDEDRPRGIPSLRTASLSVLVGIGLVGPLSAMRPVERAAAIEPVEIASAAAEPGRPTQAPAPESGTTSNVPAGPEAMPGTRLSSPGAELELPAGAGVVQADTPIVGAFQSAGSAQPNVEELIERRIHDVTPEFIRAMAAAGYPDLSHQDLIAFRIHRITPEYVRELDALGFRELPPQQLLEMRIHRMTAEFIHEMAAAGYPDLSHQELIAFRIHRITPEYIRELAAAGYPDLSNQELVAFRIHRITSEYVRELEALGYRGLSAQRLREMRIHRITPEFIRQMRDVGVVDLSPEMLARLRISGVDRDLIESRARARTPN
jgi:beta-lactamase regulating signal transducer with metallopeptidase domain